MNREIVLFALGLCLCGPTLLLSSLLPLRAPPRGDARARERGTWWRIWLPLLPTALMLAFLIGWDLQEPAESEANPQPADFLIAVPFAAIWLRAIVRSVLAVLSRDRVGPAATGGVFRPRAFVSPVLRERLDERALKAVLEHEAAHVRHFDPLRLWLAQLGTDLQWPARGARRRFREWRAALELARDDEACQRGVDGSDLAAALIEVARLGEFRSARATVDLIEETDRRRGAFRERVVRLLDRPGSPPPSRPRWRFAWAFLAAALVLTVIAGFYFGEEIVINLPGVLR